MLLTIDPGLSTGWALWSCRRLLACGLGDPRKSRHHVIVSGNANADTVEKVVIERPVIYPRSKARPNDLMTLSRAVGRWEGIYEVLGVTTATVEPAQWKGQLPKEIHHARVWAKLDDGEKDVISESVKGSPGSKLHNVMDAVGLGLWALKRST